MYGSLDYMILLRMVSCEARHSFTREARLHLVCTEFQWTKFFPRPFLFVRIGRDFFLIC